MSELPSSSSKLDYGPPESPAARWIRQIPRPSSRTIVLLLLACSAQIWFWIDHNAWIVQHTFPPGWSAFEGHISPDHTRLVTGSERGSDGAFGPFQIYDVITGQRICSLAASRDALRHAAFSPDGTRLLTISNVLQEWDTTTGDRIVDLDPVGIADGTSQCQAVFSPDGRRIVTLENGSALLYDAVTGKRIAILEQSNRSDDTGSVSRLFLSSDSSRVILLLPGPIRIHSLSDGRLLGQHWLNHMFAAVNPIYGAFSPDCKVFVLANFGWIDFIDAADASEISDPLHIGEDFAGLWFAPDGTRMSVLHETAFRYIGLSVIDVSSAKVIATSGPISNSASNFVVSPDGRQILKLDWAGIIEAFDSITLRSLHKLINRRLAYSSTMFSPDWSRVVTLNADSRKSVELFDASNWKQTSRILDHWGGMSGEYTDAIFVRDSKHLLTTTDWGVTRLWRLRRPESLLGLAILPQLWLAVLFTAWLGWSAWRDAVNWFDPETVKLELQTHGAPKQGQHN